MNINYKSIRNEMRRRVILAAGVDPETQFQPENCDFNPEGLPLWIAEHVIGGAERSLSQKRSRISAFLVQYDFFVPPNSGTDALDDAVIAVLNEFDVNDAELCSVAAAGLDVIVKSVKRESVSDRNWRRETVLFTLDAATS